MNVIEKAVRLDEAVRVFDIIEQVLTEQISTQVIVVNALYKELYDNGIKHCIYPTNCVGSPHYSTSGEKWLNHTKSGKLDTSKHLALFIANYIDYMQLVQFKTDKLNYIHFNECFQQLLIIEVEK